MNYEVDDTAVKIIEYRKRTGLPWICFRWYFFPQHPRYLLFEVLNVSVWLDAEGRTDPAFEQAEQKHAHACFRILVYLCFLGVFEIVKLSGNQRTESQTLYDMNVIV